MNYGLIVIIIAFFAGMQLAMRTNTKPLLCSFVAFGIPYIISLITFWILVQSYSENLLADLFPLSGMITFALQLVLGTIVFRKIQNEDNFVSLTSWAMGGLVVVVMIVPFLVEKIL